MTRVTEKKVCVGGGSNTYHIFIRIFLDITGYYNYSNNIIAYNIRNKIFVIENLRISAHADGVYVLIVMNFKPLIPIFKYSWSSYVKFIYLQDLRIKIKEYSQSLFKTNRK